MPTFLSGLDSSASPVERNRVVTDRVALHYCGMRHWTYIASILARYAFWPALVFAVIMAVVPKPPEIPSLNFGDKLQHMLAFFTLTVLAGSGWRQASWIKLALGLALVGAGIELVQAIPALHRSSDWRDLAADCLAILVALGPVKLFRHFAANARQA